MKKIGLTRAEAVTALLTVVFAVFVLGLRLGAGRGGAEVRISAQGAPAVTDGPAASEAVEAPAEAPSGVVNINTASSEELQSLHGIGEAIARRIIEYRSANGPFESIEEITRVSGIGSATFEEIMDSISVG